ncbi:MAG: class I SAM-dependent methyltransferase [Pseudomonadota bacterium]
MTESNPFVAMFESPDSAANYADGPAKFTPGFTDIHRMAGVLIRERAPDNAHVLVHGAGGGLELAAFAGANPGWTFVGVDPARAMLDEARRRLGENTARVRFHEGYIDDAPTGPFDAATSLLTLHFLERDARIQTIAAIAERLKSGAPFVAVHSSFPQDETAREQWLSRYEAFAIASGAKPEMAAAARTAVASNLPILAPDEDAAILSQAGLSGVTSFYAGFTWHGWIGYAP